MNRRYVFFSLVMVFLSFSVVFAQEQPSLRDRGNQFFNRYEYARAAEIFSRLVDEGSTRLSDIERAAESYYKMRDFSSAESWYSRVVMHSDHTAAHVLRYGDVLKAVGKYADARQQYERYSQLGGSASEVTARIAGCDSALLWLANPTAHVLINERGINTTGSEFSLSQIGDVLYFAGEPDAHDPSYGWTGRPFVKLHTLSMPDDGNRLDAAVLADMHLNRADYHVGPVSTPDGGRTLYVTRTHMGEETGKQKEGRFNYSTQRLELYIYTLHDGEWLEEPFEHNDPSGYSTGHATFSPDGQIMYFVSDRPGGLGGTDIWYCEWLGDGWSAPMNAGSVINTAGDELFPVVDPSGQLYYSTDGLPGMGGLDVFTTEGAKSTWTKPVNLAYPLNSSADDFSFFMVEDNDLQTRGYLSSNRSGGVGADDIYAFVLDKPQPEVVELVLIGRVTHQTSGETLPGVNVTLRAADGSLQGSVQSDAMGRFTFTIDTGMCYQVYGTMNNHHPDSADICTTGVVKSDTLEVELVLEQVLEVGKVFVLEDLYYDFDRHEIRPDAALVLDELLQTLKDNPTLKIELSSHTDSRGSDAYNLALSQRRAKSAVDYLISKGISPDRLEARGYGETRLVNECANGVECTDEQHQANRRTEIRVLDI